MPTKWEYKLVRYKGAASYTEIEDDLNERGNEGWELCGNEYGCFIFKRPINQTNKEDLP